MHVFDNPNCIGVAEFSNVTLEDMACRQPMSMEKFLQVSGVDEAKAKNYRKAFLEKLRD